MRSTTQPRSLALYILLSVSSLNFATATPAYEWPAGIDASQKYWPDGTGPPKRWLQEFAEALNQSSAAPPGVRKMSSENPGEKFYWDWEYEAQGQRGFIEIMKEESEEALEALEANVFRTPHRNLVSDNGIIGVLLGKRQNYECATGTYACTSIGVTGSCCALNETCEKIPDIGYGNVGCCPNGQQCTGNLSGCGTGKKACSSSQGGGCCIDGYDCSVNGCVPQSSSSATTTTAVVSTCSSGYYSCPTNVAGGCCPSGRLCGVSDCPSITATASGAVVTGNTCPTGYYTCAAQYNGGCCRVGRDCGITDCPERVVTISNGDTGAGGVITTALANCASGWQTCGGSLGGGCCPIGYICGVSNCPAVTIPPGYVLSGQTLSTPVVLSATSKTLPTALANIPVLHAGAGRKIGKVTEVIVVVGVVVGVVANA